MGKVRQLLLRVQAMRASARVREATPLAVYAVVGLVALLVSGVSASPAPVRATAPAPAPVDSGGEIQRAADAALSRFAALPLSRGEDIGEVRDYFAEIARKRAVPARVAKFLPLYGEAERVFGVNWRLIASVHRQETAFSASETTYHGRNFAGCCAGPMQFNLTNGPPSTWKRYKNAYREGIRPAEYHNRTRTHPSIYDDFDAIMAAGKLLRDNGGDDTLGGSAWHAAYEYYGYDLFGIQYASEVTARAQGYLRDGFCANCLPDEKLVAKLDTRFGRQARLRLVGDARTEEEQLADAARARKRKRLRRKREARRLERQEAAQRVQQRRRRRAADRERAARPPDREAAPERRRRPERTPTPTPTPKPSRPKPKPAATQAPATPAPTAAAPTPTPSPDLFNDLLRP